MWKRDTDCTCKWVNIYSETVIYAMNILCCYECLNHGEMIEIREFFLFWLYLSWHLEEEYSSISKRIKGGFSHRIIYKCLDVRESIVRIGKTNKSLHACKKGIWQAMFYSLRCQEKNREDNLVLSFSSTSRNGSCPSQIVSLALGIVKIFA